LFVELDTQWRAFDSELRSGKLKHLEFDPIKQMLTWHRPKADKDKQLQQGFYGKLQARDVADIFRFVNERCHFLAAMTPLQPRYAKKIADEDSLMAVIIAQAMNHGNFKMAETCDIPYYVLEATHQQYLRPATLIDANDIINNFIASLPIFPYFSIDMDVLYGSVDGQKFAAASPTLKARHSRKYFGKDRGVVAYTLLGWPTMWLCKPSYWAQTSMRATGCLTFATTTRPTLGRPRSRATCTASTWPTLPSCIGLA